MKMAMSKIKDDLETKESDEIPEMFCEHCDNEGKYAVAEGFCVECNDFMCDVCMKYHNKYKSDHVTQNKHTMPQDHCFEKCSIHSEKCIKFFCQECNKFACSKCSSINGNTSHEQACVSQTWSPIHTVVENTDDGLYTVKEQELANTADDIKQMEERALTTRKNWHKCNEEVRESVKSHRKDIEKRIIDLESQCLRKVDEKKDTFDDTLDNVSKDITAIKGQMNYVASYQNRVQKSHNRCLKFIAMKEYESSIHSIQAGLGMLQDKLVYTDYVFGAENSLKFDEQNFGRFVPRESKQKRTAFYKFDLDVAEYFAWILAGSLNDLHVQNGLLVAVVRAGRKIVLLDPVRQKLLSKFTTSALPARATSFSRSRIAVTLPDEGIILLLCISDSGVLKKTSDLKVEQGGWDIAYSKRLDCLFVSYLEPKSKITILNENGEIREIIDKDILGNNLFISPRNIALNFDESSLYVSDTRRDMVIKTSLDGTVETVYKDEDLKVPRGIAVDENGSVFVCGEESNNIHQLSPDLSKIGITLESKDIQSPLSIAVCKYRASKCLFVGMSANTRIKVFSLS